MDPLRAPLDELMAAARTVREVERGRLVTYSPKVFIPLTKLCRDVCHYCTFARPPRRGERTYMSEEEVLAVARAGAAAGCHEALFTLGDKPELRYRAAREELRALGCETPLEYLARCARLVLEGTGLLPHVNPGLLSRDDLRALRAVSASQGLMLESVSERLSERGGPHFGSPDKLPDRRLTTIAAAGEERVPFTSGILIGIGETRAERVESLLAIRDLGERHGHVQEVIVQNFRAKPGTRIAEAVRLRSDADGLAREDHWTAGADMPPPAAILRDIAAGTHDVPGTHDLLPDSIVSGCDARVGNGTAPKVSQPVATALAKSAEEIELDEDDVTALLRARGRDFNAVIRAADALRREVCGDTVTYVVTRNINYTNVCYFRCGFCAFSKGRLAANLRGRPYLVPVEEIVRRTEEARERGAVEVCLQGGLHPAPTGETYLEISRAIRHTVPDLHVHAFSALA